MKITEIPITDRYSTGTSISKHSIYETFINNKLINLDKKNEEKDEFIEDVEEVSLEQIDEQIMTIDDFLDDFKV